MLNVLKISEAASIAMHAMMMLAANKKLSLTTKDIASVLKVSETHLAKVMQRLVKSGFVLSCRGPGGGFELNGGGNIKLLEIYEAIDGSITLNDCLFEKSVCGGRTCIFDRLIKKVNRDFYKYLSQTTLAKLVKKNKGRAWKIS